MSMFMRKDDDKVLVTTIRAVLQDADVPRWATVGVPASWLGESGGLNRDGLTGVLERILDEYEATRSVQATSWRETEVHLAAERVSLPDKRGSGRAVDFQLKPGDNP